MKKTELVNTVSRGIHKIGFQFKKHSPEIMVVAGVVGVVTSAVMACKATTKLEQILEEPKKDIEAIHHGYDHPETLTEEYTEEDRNKDLAIVYVQAGVKVAKLYGPSILLGAVSVTSILAGHNILRKRNVALAAAYTAVDKGFKEYRGRLIERFGEELDKELRYNIKTKQIEETVVDENGEQHTETRDVAVSELGDYSIYAQFYDDGCTGFTKDAESNRKFLILQQNWANDKLKSQGYLFLNDVYESLGIPKSRAGHVVGWIYDKNNPIGDNKVDFGIYDLHKRANRDFVNRYEHVILLDFNVDGPILDRVKKF